MPGESIRYEAPFKVKMGDQDYQLYTTDKRLILFKRKGLIFKSDTFLGEKISDIQGISYSETGIISKTGIITVQAGMRTFAFKGKAGQMKILYQQIQGHTSS